MFVLSVRRAGTRVTDTDGPASCRNLSLPVGSCWKIWWILWLMDGRGVAACLLWRTLTLVTSWVSVCLTTYCISSLNPILILANMIISDPIWRWRHILLYLACVFLMCVRLVGVAVLQAAWCTPTSLSPRSSPTKPVTTPSWTSRERWLYDRDTGFSDFFFFFLKSDKQETFIYGVF